MDCTAFKRICVIAAFEVCMFEARRCVYHFQLIHLSSSLLLLEEDVVPFVEFWRRLALLVLLLIRVLVELRATADALINVTPSR